MPRLHPQEVLFENEKTAPVLAVCDHYAGREKFILKALEIQAQLGPVFDITCDCEDGAPVGQEAEHARTIVKILKSEKNKHRRAGVRVHDIHGPFWKDEVDLFLAEAGDLITHIALPKSNGVEDVKTASDYITRRAQELGLKRMIPLNIVVETHGALRDVWEIAALPSVQVLDFGLLDFISAHLGAIPAAAMISPGQFENKLIVRAKTEIAAAALANGKTPSHSITLDVKNPEAARKDALRAKEEFGYRRMWSIHPVQIAAIVEAMRPEMKEKERAENILLAGQAQSWAPIEFEGELHDRASYRYFWTVLEMARNSGMQIGEAARRAFYEE